MRFSHLHASYQAEAPWKDLCYALEVSFIQSILTKETIGREYGSDIPVAGWDGQRQNNKLRTYRYTMMGVVLL